MVTEDDLLSDDELNAISSRIDEIELLIECCNDDRLGMYLDEVYLLENKIRRSILYIELECNNLKNKKRRTKKLTLKVV